jgi:hypothetical protein
MKMSYCQPPQGHTYQTDNPFKLIKIIKHLNFSDNRFQKISVLIRTSFRKAKPIKLAPGQAKATTPKPNATRRRRQQQQRGDILPRPKPYATTTGTEAAAAPVPRGAQTMDTFYLSHGSPTLSIDETIPAWQFFKSWLPARITGDQAPRAILVVSAHWETATPAVNVIRGTNDTIYDFYGLWLPQAHTPGPC